VNTFIEKGYLIVKNNSSGPVNEMRWCYWGHSYTS